MKKLSITLFAVLVCLFGEAQHDAQWLVGCGPTTIMNFLSDSLILDSLQGYTPTFLTVANICDEEGSLLFYTNGICIEDMSGDTLENGTGINPGQYTDSWKNNGLNIPQAALFIPKPGNTNYYYLFHFSNDTLGNARPGHIYYSLINKQGNGGRGAVESKNRAIIDNVVLRGGGMTGCKHANGRDYWLIMGASDTNKFYKFLITPDSILGPFIQFIGPNFLLPYDVAYSKFSKDGTKYATAIYGGSPILVLDFDRCTGEFSNPVTIYHSATNDPVNHPNSGAESIEFSANGDLLYAANSNDLTQYNLLSSNIQDSVEIYFATDSDNARIGFLQLAGNGKIYCSTWNGGYYFVHKINYPERVGINCDFIRAGQPTLSLNSFNLPNMINYDLGSLIGSSCDTINTIITPNAIANSLRVIPNPADKYAYVEIGAQGNYTFQLINETGQLIDKKETRQVDVFNTEVLSAGVYFIQVLDRNTNTEVANRKIVIQH